MEVVEEEDLESQASSMIAAPFGYVGWIGNLGILWKVYISNVSPEETEKRYVHFFGNYALKCLKLIPKRGYTSLGQTFFAENKSFSHHYHYEDFKINEQPTNASLLDILNFIPTQHLGQLITGANEQEARKVKQKAILDKFVSAYKAFYSSQIFKPQAHHTIEHDDKHSFLAMCMAFCEDKECMVIEEAGIFPVKSHKAPSGNIDLLLLSKSDNPHFSIGIQTYGKGKSSIKSDMPMENVVSSSVKTKWSYDIPGSDRQVTVELLALSQLLLVRNSSLKVVVMLKASKDCFKPFFYFPQCDILLTCSSVPFHDEKHPEVNMMGLFLLYLLLSNLINLKIVDYLLTLNLDRKCGWTEPLTLLVVNMWTMFLFSPYQKTIN